MAFVAALVYANTLHNAPVLDDNWTIFDNPLIKHIDQVGAIFTHSYGAADPTERRGLWRPVTTLSYAINWDMGGLDVLGYHLGNIGLHVLCSLLVLKLCSVLCRASFGEGSTTSLAALLAAVLFAVHPAHVEAVAAMVGRDELLAACGALTCLYLTCTRRRAPWRYPVALGALGMGVLSKENAAVAPFLFGLIALALPGAACLEARPSLNSTPGRHALWRAGALTARMAGVVVICVLLRPTDAKIPVQAQWFHDQPGTVVFNTMTRVMAEYLRLLVFPVPQGLDFYYAAKIPFMFTFTMTCLADMVLWVGVLGFGLASLRRAPLVAVGILWVFIALLPVSNIIRTGVLMAERLLYLPSVGFCLLVGTGAAVLLERLKRRPRLEALAAGALGVAGLLLVTKTWSRNADWRDGYALWRAEVRAEPRGPIANNYVALEYMTRGQLDSAGAHLLIALTAAPEYWDATLNAGRLAYKERHDSAAATLIARAHVLAPLESDPLFYLAVLRATEGRLPDAVDLLAQAEALAPTQAWTRICRGWYLKRLGHSAEGDAELKGALQLDPSVSLGNCVASVL